jgi:TonB family protein
MNIPLRLLGAAGLTLLFVHPHLAAQDVIVGEPGWFKSDDAPDVPPQTKGHAKVEYPDALLTSDESSYVILVRYLDDKGRGLMMETHSTHPWFKRAVEFAIANWQMTPAKRHDRPVASWFWIPVIFNPKSASPDKPDAKPRLLAVSPVVVPPAIMARLQDATTAWGTVSLDAAGLPQKVTLEHAEANKLQTFVESALKQWRFAPARQGDQPVAADFRVAFHFFPPMGSVPGKARPPRAIRQSPPVYPYNLRRNNITGQVLVGFVVDTKGQVVNAVAIRSTSPAFNEAAVEAVLSWKFEPAMVDGRAVNTAMSVPMVFDFNDGGGGREQVEVEAPSRRAQQKMPEELRFDVAPKSRGVVPPVYPYFLLREGTTGKATVLFEISPEGRVVGVKIAEASHPEFGLALAAAVERYEFDPALKNGKPTTAVLKTSTEFSISDLVPDEDRSLLRQEKRKPASIVTAGKLDKPPHMILTQRPVFPRTLHDHVDHGSATVEVLIDEKGRVRLPRIVEASDPAFGYAAVQALASCMFEPPKVGGETVIARVSIPFSFDVKPPVMGIGVGEKP